MIFSDEMPNPKGKSANEVRHLCEVPGCNKSYANSGGLSKHMWRDHNNKREAIARVELPKGSVLTSPSASPSPKSKPQIRKSQIKQAL